jgi:AcrR family transcriptional regulator
VAKGKAESGKAGASTGAARLPAGRHGLPPELIAQNQRERMITALADTVAEHGYNATTIANITEAAGVSRRTFYEQFPSKEACFLAAYDLVAEHILGSMRAAAESFDSWPQQVRAALATGLRFLAGEPELARLTVIEPVSAGGAIAARHRESLGALVGLLKETRPERPADKPLPEATEEAIVGGILSLLSREINAGRAKQLEKLLPDLVELVLTPYLGSEDAESFATSA